jgi:hypothetical protein
MQGEERRGPRVTQENNSTGTGRRDGLSLSARED